MMDSLEQLHAEGHLEILFKEIGVAMYKHTTENNTQFLTIDSIFFCRICMCEIAKNAGQIAKLPSTLRHEMLH